MKKPIVQMIAALACIAPVAMSSAQTSAFKPFVGCLFTDNMVLQRGVKDPVWGWTTPGAKVTVSIAGKTASAQAGPDGKWLVRLPVLPVGGPYTLSIKGPQELDIQNVLVGDVWLCSGQSNMQMGVGGAIDGAKEIANSNYPKIRLFTVPDVPSMVPLDNNGRQWDVCSPDSISDAGGGNFSAVAYFFGRDLFQELGVPIGLLHASWGGTVAESWTSSDALKNYMPEFVPAVHELELAVQAKKQEEYAASVRAWFEKNDPGSRLGADWQSSQFDDSAWKTMPVPKVWEQTVLPDYDGVVWLRKEVTLRVGLLGTAKLSLGTIDNQDTTWINGRLVGTTSDYGTHRTYPIAPGVLKPGRNVITIRVLDTGGAGGFTGKADQLTLTVGGSPISLAGDWKYNASADFRKTEPFPKDPLNNPNNVSLLYNGMIAPLVPFAIKGAIWYQGENNADRAEQYGKLLPTMITDWRKRFDVGDFPFYIVQLAGYMPHDTEPKNDDWPRLREAQFLTTKRVVNAGIATAVDIGEEFNVHPQNKQEVGRRLALNALALTYGKKIEYSGPVYKAFKVEENKVRISFDHAVGGLVPKGGAPVQGFAIAGSDGKFVWADAKIVGETVLVWSDKISRPTAVRYAWSNNPVANLTNKAGLPALPFRTDGPSK